MFKGLSIFALSMILSAQVAVGATDEIKDMTEKVVDKAGEVAEEAKEIPGEVAEKAEKAVEDVKELGSEIMGEKKEKEAATQPAMTAEEWAAFLEKRHEAMPAEQKAKVEKLASDLATAADAATLQAGIADLAVAEPKPEEGITSKLAGDLKQAFEGKTLDEKESVRMAQNIEVLINKEGLERAHIRMAMEDSGAIMKAKEVEASAMRMVNRDLRALWMGKKAGEAATKPARKAGRNRGETGQVE